MWTNYFKSSYLHQYITLVIIQLLFWLPYFIAPDQLINPESSTPLYKFIFNFLNTHLIIAVILGFVLVFLQGFLLNNFLVKNNVVSTNSLFPAFIYIVFSSSLLPVHTITPVLLVNFFPIYMISSLNTLYKENEPIRSLFDFGILLGITVLVYNQVFFFLVLIYACLFVMRLFSWRIIIIPIIGLITIGIFTTSYYFLTDGTFQFIEYLTSNTVNFKFDLLNNPDYNVFSLIIFLIISLLIIVSLINNFLTRNKKNIDIRKKILIITHQFFFILIFWMFSNSHYNSIIILVVPMTSLLAHYADKLKRNSFLNYIFWIILFLSLYNNFTDNLLIQGGF